MSKARFIHRLIDSFKNNHNKIAVIDQNGTRQTTYGDFYTTALRVAAYLQARRLSPHSFIPVCLPTGMDYMASEIGIWLSGHAAVPVSNLFPQERIDYITAHCEASLVIDEAVMKEMMATPPTDTLIMPEEDDVSTLFYTSGSTGNPKGVLHSFKAFGGEVPLDKLLEEMHLSVMGVTTPFYYIASRSVFCVLFRGGTLTIVPPSVTKDIQLLEAFLAEQKIEFTFLPPSLLAHFRSKSEALKLVMTGAERLSNIHPEGFTLINHYGQTETCGAGATFIVDKPYENTPIGKPAAHVRYCILDENGQEAEEGELCMKGNLTLGYYKDPERTAQLYQGGWLHTGDIVRRLPEGNLVYVNRKDWLIKVNGQRVEPGEVEMLLQRMEGVENAVVKGFTSATGRQYLCAYYITAADIREQDIREYLTTKLPDYMIPSYFVKMDSFPLNINRKIDRKALLSPIADASMIEHQPYMAPQNETERLLCEAFEQTLGISRIGINDDFFSLGGDSIRVIQLQTLCPSLSLSAGLIYQHRTPRRIANAYAKAGALEIKPQMDYPLSQTQQGIFAASMARQGEIVYNNGMLFRLGKGVDLARLAKALEAVIEAHTFVKTRLYIDEKGQPRQRRNDDETYLQDIETVSEANFEQLRPQLMQPFFLLADRLFRIRIFSTPSAAYLFMDFHHIIFDGYSLEVLLHDLSKAYDGQSLQRETWSGFEVAQEEELLRKTEAYQQAAAWNKEHFGHLDIVSLPEADLHEETKIFAQENLLLDIPYQELEEACSKMGVTPNVLTTTVFGYLLGAYSYAQESLFATVYNGRKDLKTSSTISMMVKTLPVHVSWHHQPTVCELLHTMKQQLLGSMANDLYSFNEQNAQNSCINSSVLFAWQGDLISTETIGGQLYQPLPIMENATGEMLVMQLFRQDEGLRLNAEYQANAYSQVFISRMMQCYRQLLHGFIEASEKDKPLSALSLIPKNEQTALITLGTGEHLDFDTSQTFTSLFVKQALRTPDATAVVDKDKSITYAELNRQSDILAAALRKAHVTTDTFVGLMLPRRISFMISVLAVFKAGGTYIPLDCDYPYSRLKYMIDDSQAPILITTKRLLENKKAEGTFPVQTVILFDEIDFDAPSSPINESKPSSLAYMIYTSGSTGMPKGVMVEHRGLLNFLEWLLKVEQLKAGEQVAIHTSFSFDGSVFDLFPPLMCGGTLHILPTSLRQDLKGIYHYLVEHDIVGMLLTTQLGMAMQMQYDLPLRFLMLGGEKLTYFKPSALQLFNCYGPTEFTVCSSYYQIDQNRNYENIPIGRPAPNTISAVVNTEGHLVPRGVIGELCLLGCQLTRGYWKRPELTTEKFVASPFIHGELMYRTGDLVRWNDENQLEYIGRIDSQTKLRGFRIELGEIENKIREYPDVNDAAVIIHTSGKAQYLVGFYCADYSIEAEMLRQTLDEQLPDYMIPQQFIQLESLPMTPNGKVDRQALTTYETAATWHPAMVAARNYREQLILDLARDLLGTNKFGVTDDLTMLGLNSLTAISLVSMASAKGEELKVNDVLRLRTIEEIAAHQSTIGNWVQGYDATKPVAVVIQGLTSYRLLLPLITALCRHHSVFVIEPIQEHFSKTFAGKTKTDIVTTYIELIKQNLPANVEVSAFVGHSYGGEFSYRCAAKWQSETGQSPRVILFDTYFNASKVIEKMRHMQEYVVPVEDGVPMPFYNGKVDYFQATHMSFLDLKQENEKSWRQLLPHINMHPLPTSHFRLLEKQNINYCLSQIEL